MANANTPDAAGHDPAASSAAPDFDIEIWPHRSLTPQVYRNFLIILLGAFGLVFGMIALAPFAGSSGVYGAAMAIVGGFILSAILLTRWAIRRHSGEARGVRERITVAGDALIVQRADRRGRREWRFSSHWAQIRMRDSRSIKRELLVMQSGRAVSIGLFLTPEERLGLATELRGALAKIAAA